MPSPIPQAQCQFLDANGAPLAGGSVYTYVPGTLTPKTTYADAAGNTTNPNPIILDSAGRCTIWGSGQYRQQVYDSSANLIWDTVTAVATVWDLLGQPYAVDTGAVNALAVTLSPAPKSLASLTGVPLYIVVANTTTGAATLNVNNLGAVAIEQGGVPLVSGALQANAIYPMVYTGSAWLLIGSANSAVTLGQMQDGSINPTFGNTTTGSIIANGNGLTLGNGNNNSIVTFLGYGTDPEKSILVGAGVFQIRNNAGTPILQLDDAGNLHVLGNIQSNGAL